MRDKFIWLERLHGVQEVARSTDSTSHISNLVTKNNIFRNSI
jgi:hypothetical protein